MKLIIILYSQILMIDIVMIYSVINPEILIEEVAEDVKTVMVISLQQFMEIMVVMIKKRSYSAE